MKLGKLKFPQGFALQLRLCDIVDTRHKAERILGSTWPVVNPKSGRVVLLKA